MSDWRTQAAKQVAESSASGGGNYFNCDGDYGLLVDKLWWKQGDRGLTFIAEFQIETAKATESWCEPHAPGQKRSSAYNFKHKSSPGNVKALILSLLGMTEAQLSAMQSKANEEGKGVDVLVEFMDNVTSDANPMRGARVRATTYRHATLALRGKYGDAKIPEEEKMVILNYHHIKGQTKKEIGQRRDAMEKSTAAKVTEPVEETAETPTGGAAEIMNQMRQG